MRAFVPTGLLALCLCNVTAQGICWQENAGPTFNNGTFIGPGFGITAVRLTAAGPLSISGVEVFTGEVIGTGAISVWTHDAINQRPQRKLGERSFSVQNALGFQGTDLPAPIVLGAGQIVWVGWALPLAAQSPVDGTKQVPGQFYRTSLDAGHTWFGPFQFNASHLKFRLRGPCGPCDGYTTAFGPACGPRPAPATLSGGGCPAASHALVLRAENAAPAQPGVMLIAASRGSSSIGPCGVVVGPALLGVPIAFDARGQITIVVALPPSLLSLDLFVQMLFVDPLWTAGIGATNGLEVGVR